MRNPQEEREAIKKEGQLRALADKHLEDIKNLGVFSYSAIYLGLPNNMQLAVGIGTKEQVLESFLGLFYFLCEHYPEDLVNHAMPIMTTHLSTTELTGGES